MNQEQLMKVKIKYLEDRLNTLERSLASVIEHQFSNLNVLEDKARTRVQGYRYQEQGQWERVNLTQNIL